MIEIKYKNSDAGVQNFFELEYDLKKYIPEKYWQGNIFDTEKSFYFDLMDKSELFTCDRDNVGWFAEKYKCTYKENIFYMSVDYGICSFFVTEYEAHLSEIAEALKNLIIKSKEKSL